MSSARMMMKFRCLAGGCAMQGTLSAAARIATRIGRRWNLLVFDRSMFVGAGVIGAAVIGTRAGRFIEQLYSETRMLYSAKSSASRIDQAYECFLQLAVLQCMGLTPTLSMLKWTFLTSS